MGPSLSQVLWAFALMLVASACESRRPIAPRAMPDAAPVAVAAITDGGAAVVDAAAPPESLRIGIESEPVHLNPDLDPDRWAFRIAFDNIYEPLIRRAPGGGHVPVLAERFSVEDEGRRITFHLRPGVKFHDDQPLTADDVGFTFDRVRSPRTHAPRVQAELLDLERVEVVSPHVVRLWARRPSAFLIDGIAEIGILPMHVFSRGELMYQPANRRPVGTGPYRLKSWERGKHILLERWEDYRGPKPAIPSIDFLVEEDAARALGKAKRGELDVLGRVPPAYVPEQLDSPSLQAGWEVVRVEASRFTFVVWNTARAPLGDPAVRRALGRAIDRAKLVSDVRHGLGRPLVAPPAGLGPAAAPGDIALAAAALDAAGATRSGTGPRTLGGRPWRMTLLVPTGARESEEAGKRVADVLGKLGIGVEVAAGDLVAITARLKRGTFDGALLAWAGRDDDDLAPLFRTGGVQNFGRYSSRGADALLDELRLPAAPEARRALGARLAAALADDPPALFLYAPDEIFLKSRRVAALPRFGDFVLLREARLIGAK